MSPTRSLLHGAGVFAAVSAAVIGLAALGTIASAGTAEQIEQATE